MDRNEIIRIGRDARSILEMDAFKLAVERVKDSAFQGFLQSGYEDGAERDALWAMAKSADKVQEALVAIGGDGSVEEDKLNAEKRA